MATKGVSNIYNLLQDGAEDVSTSGEKKQAAAAKGAAAPHTPAAPQKKAEAKPVAHSNNKAAAAPHGSLFFFSGLLHSSSSSLRLLHSLVNFSCIFVTYDSIKDLTQLFLTLILKAVERLQLRPLQLREMTLLLIEIIQEELVSL